MQKRPVTIRLPFWKLMRTYRSEIVTTAILAGITIFGAMALAAWMGGDGMWRIFAVIAAAQVILFGTRPLIARIRRLPFTAKFAASRTMSELDFDQEWRKIIDEPEYFTLLGAPESSLHTMSPPKPVAQKTIHVFLPTTMSGWFMFVPSMIIVGVLALSMVLSMFQAISTDPIDPTRPPVSPSSTMTLPDSYSDTPVYGP